jgi:hypothetical protein
MKRSALFMALAAILAMIVTACRWVKASVPREGGPRAGPQSCGAASPGTEVELDAVAALLRDRQCIDIGPPVAPDAPGGGLVHFQRFAAPGSTTVSSGEVHRDGCIYIAYTAARSPVWYATTNANEASDHVDDPLSAGASGEQSLASLKASNVDPTNWKTPAEAYRNGHGPAARWFRACFRDRDPTHWSEKQKDQIPLSTPDDFMQNAGAYCEWDAAGATGPEEWATVLPKDTPSQNLRQKKYFPDQPLYAVVNGITNFYPTWLQLESYAQHKPEKLRELLAFLDPNEDVYESTTVPWVKSTVAGIVTNSFLSGGDYDGSHANPPGIQILGGQGFLTSYWLGVRSPNEAVYGWYGTGNQFKDVDSVKDDWIVYVLPDPEYRFFLARSVNATKKYDDDRILGNFDGEHRGNLENEIEQWLMPVGFRPDPGDRIFMEGRWVIDCGPGDWTSEIHPYELVISTHAETRKTAIDSHEATSAVTITSDWTGDTLEFDLWPSARPKATARLRCARDPVTPSPQFPRGLGIGQNVSVSQILLPRDNPNHAHIMVISRTMPDALKTESRNNVDPYFKEPPTVEKVVTRRLAATYRLWWEEGGETARTCVLDAVPP